MAPEEEALAQVAAAAAERARKVERVGLYKDYVPGKDRTCVLVGDLCARAASAS